MDNLFSLILLFFSLLSILYATSYANYEFQHKNKKGAIILYIIALFCLIISFIQPFF